MINALVGKTIAKSPMENAMNVQTLTEQYRKAVEVKLQEAYNFQAPADRPTVEIETGRKYFKIVKNFGHQRSVHSFVDRATGDVLKAATWAAPAKGVRFNLVTGLDGLLAVIDPYGGYLYLK
jgi:hypothetical protein